MGYDKIDLEKIKTLCKLRIKSKDLELYRYMQSDACFEDGFSFDDLGNLDDNYHTGQIHGRLELALEILKEFGVEYE